MKYIYLFLFILFSQNYLIEDSYGYPQFSGFGYDSCLTCHYNPFGNGPLTDYGRALGATTVSARSFYKSTTTDEYLGEHSGFAHSKINPRARVRPSFDYRGLHLQANLGQEAEKTEFIHMDAVANVVLRLGPKKNEDKFFASVSFGHAPAPRSKKNWDEPEYRSREHYLGLRMTKNSGLYIGLMDKVFGIRIPDHIAFSKITTNTTMNDQAHGLLYHYTGKLVEIGINPFIGNLSQDANLRQKGSTAHFEYSWDEKLRVGVSGLFSSSTYLSQQSYAAFMKKSFGKGSSILAEMGTTTKTAKLGTANRSSQYFFLQSYVLLQRGLFTFGTFEFLNANTENEDKVLRVGPGIQYFPIQGLEFRLDIYNSRVFAKKTISDDVWNLTTQVHLWF